MTDDPRRTTARGGELPHGVEQVSLPREHPLTVDQIRMLILDHHQRIRDLESIHRQEETEREASNAMLLESVKAYVQNALAPVVLSVNGLAKGLTDVATFVREARDAERAKLVLEEQRAQDDARVDKLLGRRKEARSYSLMTYAVITAPCIALLVALLNLWWSRSGK